METSQLLQDKGLHAGRSAVFVRLADCDVGCPWCDTKPSWELEDHPRRFLAELAFEVAAAASAGASFAVITRGEPLEHDLGPLCAALVQGAPVAAAPGDQRCGAPGTQWPLRLDHPLAQAPPAPFSGAAGGLQ